jgi:hypothetical protein
MNRTITLADDLDEAVSKQARADGVTEAEIVREALRVLQSVRGDRRVCWPHSGGDSGARIIPAPRLQSEETRSRSRVRVPQGYTRSR